jgi:F-type H+-transporting ATPase subunit epsilon
MSDAGRTTIHLKVISPRRLVAEADVDSIELPSLEGEIGILPGHRPLFVGIGKGRVRFLVRGEEQSRAVRGGYAQVLPEKVVIMTDVDEDDEEGGDAPA